MRLGVQIVTGLQNLKLPKVFIWLLRTVSMYLQSYDYLCFEKYLHSISCHLSICICILIKHHSCEQSVQIYTCLRDGAEFVKLGNCLHYPLWTINFKHLTGCLQVPLTLHSKIYRFHNSVLRWLSGWASHIQFSSVGCSLLRIECGLLLQAPDYINPTTHKYF